MDGEKSKQSLDAYKVDKTVNEISLWESQRVHWLQASGIDFHLTPNNNKKW